MKGDRWEKFEQLVMKTVGDRETISAGEFVYFTLVHFKREHAAVVNAIGELKKNCKARLSDRFFTVSQQEGYEQACKDILAALATRKGRA